MNRFALALAAFVALAPAAPAAPPAKPAPVAKPAARPAARPAATGAPSAVRGVVTVTGQKTNAWAVVSLEAENLPLSPPAGPVKMDQKGFRFIPRVIAIQTGGAIRFLNNDPEPHNVYSPEGRYNLGTWPTGDTKDHVFTKPGIYSQLCNIHPDMLAFVVVLDTPYFAVTDEAGNYVIRDVPPGKYTLVVWHEKKDGLEREVTVEAGKPLKLDLVVEQ
jgi:plastocyanin